MMGSTPPGIHEPFSDAAGQLGEPTDDRPRRVRNPACKATRVTVDEAFHLRENAAEARYAPSTVHPADLRADRRCTP